MSSFENEETGRRHTRPEVTALSEAEKILLVRSCWRLAENVDGWYKHLEIALKGLPSD